MNLNTTVGQAACQLLCRYTQSTLVVSCVGCIVPIVTCDYQKNLWLFMFEMHLISGIARGTIDLEPKIRTVKT